MRVLQQAPFSPSSPPTHRLPTRHQMLTSPFPSDQPLLLRLPPNFQSSPPARRSSPHEPLFSPTSPWRMSPLPPSLLLACYSPPREFQQPPASSTTRPCPLIIPYNQPSPPPSLSSTPLVAAPCTPRPLSASFFLRSAFPPRPPPSSFISPASVYALPLFGSSSG